MKAEYNNSERMAEAAFTKQSPVFDQEYGSNHVIQYKRERVRSHIQNYLAPASSILELNCGTGEDAIFFAHRGHSVHATDISAGMLDQAGKKISALDLTSAIKLQQLSYHDLHLLRHVEFDHVFSNFGGLNCTPDLEEVLKSIHPLLKQGGCITLVLISRFCLWESVFALKGQFRTATRRMFSRRGRKAVIEGQEFNCWYYRPSDVIKSLSPEYELLSVEGLCTMVPPSYKDKFLKKHPAIFNFLCAGEQRYKSSWPWKFIGDYFIISLRKKC